MAASPSFKTEFVLKNTTPILAVAGFLWGIYTYQDNAKQQLRAQVAEHEKTAETRRIEATKPFLDRQLELYTEAIQVTATIATSTDEEELADATMRFQELYWGELALVERTDVAAAMVAFHTELTVNGGERGELQRLSLDLAHACRDELADSWNTDAWRRE